MSRSITLVSVCDDHYIMLLAALIKSIEINHAAEDKINYYIIEDRVSESNKRKLERSVKPGQITLYWINMQENIPEDIKLPADRSTYPQSVYMRLFLPEIVAPGTERVLYLDVDMIVVRDLSDLLDTPLNHHIVAAARDPYIQTFADYGGIPNYEELGLSGAKKYFNSGLMVIDVNKWKQLSIGKKVVDCINNNKKHLMFPDQYGLNVVLADDWAELNPSWNSHAELSNEEAYVIHFSGRKPIFSTYNNRSDYKEVFYHYLNQTEWRGLKPVGETKRYFKKIRNMIEKFSFS